MSSCGGVAEGRGVGPARVVGDGHRGGRCCGGRSWMRSGVTRVDGVGRLHARSCGVGKRGGRRAGCVAALSRLFARGKDACGSADGGDR